MARNVKYIRRTGTKGNYQYFYADGSSRSDRNAKLDHVKRLLVARLRGEHNKSNQEIVDEVGLEPTGRTPAKQAVNTQLQTMRRRKGGTSAGHDYSESQIKESTLQPGTPEYERRITKVKAELGRRGVSSDPTPTIPEAAPSRPSRARRPAAPATPPVAPSSTQADIDKIKKLRAKLAARGHALPGSGVEHLVPAEPTPVVTIDPHAALRSDLSGESGWIEISPGIWSFDNGQLLLTAKADGAGVRIKNAEGTAREYGSMHEAMGSQQIYQAMRRRQIRQEDEITEVEIDIPAPARPAAAAAAARAASTAASAALADPEVEATEAPIRRMSEVSEAGGNPYLDRAKEIFERVKNDVKPERKQHAEYMMQAISQAGATDQAALKAKYMEISGKRNFKGAIGDFEKSTFMTMDEIKENKPIDMAVERMRRGYPAMQVARLKPHLKDSFASAHPDAPPPMPTWGDLKTWREAGGDKPDWAGTTRTSVPKEVFDAAVKANGKPLYPPAWMPVHLMPLWNYVGQKVGATAYQTPAPGQRISPEGKVDVGSQATYQEGVIIASLRKYVQMRGGPDQLVDIPKSKLAEVGLSHEKIFKAEGLGIAQLKEIMKYKIIDLVELVPFIDEVMAQKVKKSYSLVVGVGERPFEKSNKSEERLRKSLIGKIQRLRSEKKFSYMSKM